MKLKHLSYFEEKLEDKKYFPTIENLSAQIYELLSLAYEESPWTRAYILADIINENSDYFFLEEEGQIVGLLAISTIMDELEITNIAIHPDFQGQGLASFLLTEVFCPS